MRALLPHDEAEQVAIVEELEPVHLVDTFPEAPQPVRDLTRELEAQVDVRGPQVDEQVPGSGHRRVTVALDLGEGVQMGRAGRGIQSVPEVGTDPGDAQQLIVGIADGEAADEARHVGQKVPDLTLGASARVKTRNIPARLGGARRAG